MRKLTLAMSLAVSSLLLASMASAAEDRSDVLSNIEPVGKVRIAGLNIADPAAAPAPAPAAPAAPVADAAAAPAAPAAVDGKQVYSTVCFACHGTGAAGAPKLGDTAAWAPRIAMGMEALMSSAVNGKNAMPPRGGNPTVTDEQIAAAIDYMVSNSQ